MELPLVSPRPPSWIGRGPAVGPRVPDRSGFGTRWDCGLLPLGSIAESFNDWGGGRGCHKFVPVSGEDGMKTPPPGDLFGQPPGEMS